MLSKRLVVGCIGLVTGVLWVTLLLAQGARLGVARSVITSHEPLAFRLSVVPTLALGAAGALLVLPLLVGGTGTMLGVPACLAVLRRCTQVGLAVSGLVVVAFGATVLPSFGGPGGWLAPAAALELAVAANLLVLQGAVLWLLTRQVAKAPLTA